MYLYQSFKINFLSLAAFSNQVFVIRAYRAVTSYDKKSVTPKVGCKIKKETRVTFT